MEGHRGGLGHPRREDPDHDARAAAKKSLAMAAQQDVDLKQLKPCYAQCHPPPGLPCLMCTVALRVKPAAMSAATATTSKGGGDQDSARSEGGGRQREGEWRRQGARK